MNEFVYDDDGDDDEQQPALCQDWRIHVTLRMSFMDYGGNCRISWTSPGMRKLEVGGGEEETGKLLQMQVLSWFNGSVLSLMIMMTTMMMIVDSRYSQVSFFPRSCPMIDSVAANFQSGRLLSLFLVPAEPYFLSFKNNFTPLKVFPDKFSPMFFRPYSHLVSNINRLRIKKVHWEK